MNKSVITLLLVIISLMLAPSALAGGGQNGNGANTSGPYDANSTGAPSANGNGNGQANGKPCAGCVGNADDKNPPGQQPGGSDANNGYECDGNHGVGQGNPAHTGCQPQTVTAPPSNPPTIVPPSVTPTPDPGTPSTGTTVTTNPVVNPSDPTPDPTASPTDVCDNIEGVQTHIPSGMIANGADCAGINRPVTATDVCMNIPGLQAKVPKGYVKKGTKCLKVQVKGKKKHKAAPHKKGKKHATKPKQLPYTP